MPTPGIALGLIVMVFRSCKSDGEAGLKVRLVFAGHILDWDTKPQKTGGSDTNFSAAKYAELLEEDI